MSGSPYDCVCGHWSVRHVGDRERVCRDCRCSDYTLPAERTAAIPTGPERLPGQPAELPESATAARAAHATGADLDALGRPPSDAVADYQARVLEHGQ